MATSLASCEAIWLCKMFTGFFGLELDPTVIRYDNQSNINLLKDPVLYDKSKHIEIKYHFTEDKVQRGVVKVQYISTNEQVANILMKPLMKGKSIFYMDKLVLV